MASAHRTCLARLCRICGRLLGSKYFEVAKHTERLSKAFLATFTSDNSNIHPQKMCHSCYCSMMNIEKRETTSQTRPVKWDAHQENCKVCKTQPKGGRECKKKRNLEGPQIKKYGQGQQQIVFYKKHLKTFHFHIIFKPLIKNLTRTTNYVSVKSVKTF